MKKLSFLFLPLFLITGCNTLSSIDSNEFITARPRPIQSSLVGFWVGASGPYLNTLKLNSDGSGEFCYSWNTKNVLGKVIFDGKNLILQSGEKLEVTNIRGSSFTGKANYYMGSEIQFYRDDNLIKSSTYCQSQFAK